MTRRPLGLVAGGIFSLSLLVYAVGAFNSPLLDERQKAAHDLLLRHAKAGKFDKAQERVLAELYWSRYSDVAGDWYFGRNGKLGLWGAREHYKRHGKREGREWPALPK